MDLSKLPRLGNSGEPAPAPASATDVPTPPEAIPQRVEYVPVAPPAGPEGFINVVIGCVLIWMSWPIFDWIIHKLSGRAATYSYTDENGAPMEFTRSVFFPINLGTGLFALALLVQGLLSSSGSLRIQQLILLLLCVAAAANAYAIFEGFRVLNSPQIVSILAGAFAIYLAMYQFQLVRLLKRAPAKQ